MDDFLNPETHIKIYKHYIFSLSVMTSNYFQTQEFLK